MAILVLMLWRRERIFVIALILRRMLRGSWCWLAVVLRMVIIKIGIRRLVVRRIVLIAGSWVNARLRLRQMRRIPALVLLLRRNIVLCTIDLCLCDCESKRSCKDRSHCRIIFDFLGSGASPF